METEHQLFANLKIIFDNEIKDMTENEFRPKIYAISLIKRGPIKYQMPENKICLDNSYIIDYKNFELLFALYQKLTLTSLKIKFVEFLKNHIITNIENISIHNSSMETNTAGLAVYFLIRIKRTDIVKESIIKRIENEKGLSYIYLILKMALTYDYSKLDETDLNNIELAITYSKKKLTFKLRSSYDGIVYDNNINYEKKVIKELIHEIRLLWLEKNLSENINYEINQDKERLQEIVKDYGFDKNINEALNKIDEALYAPNNDEFDYQKNISSLKAVFDKFTEPIYKEIVKSCKETPKKKHEKEHDTEMKHRFIGEKLNFSEGENKTMTGINKMLNEEKHGLITNKEKLRLTKNMTIEFLLMMLTKYQNFKSKSN